MQISFNLTRDIETALQMFVIALQQSCVNPARSLAAGD
jgi:hypothetical protein